MSTQVARHCCRDGGLMIQRKLFANFRNHRVFNLSEADIAHRDLIVRFSI